MSGAHPARIAWVEEALARGLADIDGEVQFVPAADWYLHIDKPQGVYGWTFPELTETGLTLAVSPQVIAYQTRDRKSAEVLTYVDAIVWLCKRHIEVSYTGATVVAEDPVLLQQRLESDLYDYSPEALRTLSEVQLSVLES